MKMFMFHGLGSNTQKSQTCQLFRETFDNVITPSWNFNNLQQIIDEIMKEQDDHLVLCGISFGGYIARYLANSMENRNIELVLLNPLIDPSNILVRDTYTDYTNNETVTITDDAKELIRDLYIPISNDGIPTTVVVAKDDNIIDPSIAIDEYENRARMIILDEGGHRLSNPEYIMMVKESIETLL